MIFRALDSDDDWTFGTGRQNYLRGNDAIRLNVKTRLKSFLGDCWFDTAAGIDWWNLMGSKNPAAEPNTILACRSSIAQAYGIAAINSFTSSVNARTRRLTATFDATTIFNSTVAGSVQP